MPPREHKLHVRQFQPHELLDRKKDAALPDGVCGRLIGQACTYNVVDAYGTFFKPGCFDRTRAEKVPAGRVGIFRDHDHVSQSHVGVVRELRDVGDGVMMSADLFDTPEGRDCKEYMSTVLQAKSYTGLSVGVYPRAGAVEADPADPQGRAYGFSEVELAEISITPFPAVPGADVMAVRRSPEDALHGQQVALRMLLTSMPREGMLVIAREFGLIEPVAAPVPASRDAEGRTPADSGKSSRLVSRDARLAFLRDSFLTTDGGVRCRK